jgi:hypothetical protein
MGIVTLPLPSSLPLSARCPLRHRAFPAHRPAAASPVIAWQDSPSTFANQHSRRSAFGAARQGAGPPGDSCVPALRQSLRRRSYAADTSLCLRARCLRLFDRDGRLPPNHRASTSSTLGAESAQESGTARRMATSRNRFVQFFRDFGKTCVYAWKRRRAFHRFLLRRRDGKRVGALTSRKE